MSFKTLEEYKNLAEEQALKRSEDERRDLADTLFFAFRYALGRKTYSSGVVQNTIKKHFHLFSVSDLTQMKKEIEKANLVGTDDWYRFHLWLEQKITEKMLAASKNFNDFSKKM